MKTDLFAGNKDWASLESALAARGLAVRGKSCQCPWHDDQTPSASILEDSDGSWRVYCHVCNRRGDVYDVTGERPEMPAAPVSRPAQPPEQPKRRLPSIEAIKAFWSTAEQFHEYTNAQGQPVLLVVRHRRANGKKGFDQWHPDGNGWENSAGPKPWPLYNQTGIRNSTVVLVVEGEKCVDAVTGLGISATTSPCGATNAACADWSPLAGKTVYLWPDNDLPDAKTGKRGGLEYMQSVRCLLERLQPPPTIHWIDPDSLGLKAKGDVADFIAEMGDVPASVKADGVRDVMADAKPISDEVGDLLNAMIAGTHKPIAWPWARLSGAARALMPGTVTLLCGEAGSTKSFMLLEAAAFWHRDGIPVAVFELEEDRKYHLHRAMAQQSNEARLLDHDWVRENADLALDIYKHSKDFLHTFKSCIWEAPDKQVTLDELADWVRDRSKEGNRIVAIDPVTAAACNDKPWVADQKFIMAAKTIVRDYGNSLILVTHPTKDAKQKQISGGAAYMRFAQAALWLGVTDGNPNRELHILKARNGRGTKLCIGYDFSGKTLRFTEVGIIKGDALPEAQPKRVPNDRFADKPQPDEDLFA